MIIFATIVGVLFLLFALILFLPLLAGIEYLNQDGKQKLFLRIRLLGIPLKIRVPIKNETKKPKKEREKKDEEKPKKKLTFARFRTIIDGFCEAYDETKDDIKDVLSDIRKKLEFQTLVFHVHFGLSDAAKTGIATGATWTSASCALSVLNQMFAVRNLSLDVAPDFNRECFELHIKSILKLRPVHIISIGLKIIKIVNLFIEKMDIK